MIDFNRVNYDDNSCRQELALVFIKNQILDKLYSVEEGFEKGTAFPELYKPLRPNGVMR